jgi:hypothetical protein
LQFPSNPNDMLLSGTLAGGQALANRAQLVDVPLGHGHVVSFAIRPFWRWQTQGTYFFPGVQRDSELERSGCRADGRSAAGNDERARALSPRPA